MAAIQEFKSVRDEIAGLPMHAVVSASAPALPNALVLVHGLGLSGRYLMPTAKMLRQRYRVLVPDLPGFGESGKPRHILDVPQLADRLAAWMRARRLGRAHLLGNSFGCQIIVDFAARYPDQVDRLVLQGPTTTPAERSWLWQWVRWRQNSPYNPPRMGEIAKRDYDKCGRLRAVLTFRKSLFDRVEDKLPLIGAPTLVVRGQYDPICRPEWAEEVAKTLSDGRLIVIPGVAHTLVFTSPHELASVTVPFLEEVGGAACGVSRAC